MSDGKAARTVARLRETLAAHFSDERGVALDARSWLAHGPARALNLQLTMRRGQTPGIDSRRHFGHARSAIAVAGP